MRLVGVFAVALAACASVRPRVEPVTWNQIVWAVTVHRVIVGELSKDPEQNCVYCVTSGPVRSRFECEHWAQAEVDALLGRRCAVFLWNTLPHSEASKAPRLVLARGRPFEAVGIVPIDAWAMLRDLRRDCDGIHLPQGSREGEEILSMACSPKSRDEAWARAMRIDDDGFLRLVAGVPATQLVEFQYGRTTQLAESYRDYDCRNLMDWLAAITESRLHLPKYVLGRGVWSNCGGQSDDVRRAIIAVLLWTKEHVHGP